MKTGVVLSGCRGDITADVENQPRIVAGSFRQGGEFQVAAAS